MRASCDCDHNETCGICSPPRVPCKACGVLHNTGENTLCPATIIMKACELHCKDLRSGNEIEANLMALLRAIGQSDCSMQNF